MARHRLTTDEPGRAIATAPLGNYWIVLGGALYSIDTNPTSVK